VTNGNGDLESVNALLSLFRIAVASFLGLDGVKMLSVEQSGGTVRRGTRLLAGVSFRR
jgi:hypothetical protein